MDWQFKIGVGIALVFGLLAFAVKEIPHPISWPGIAIGCLLVVWGIPLFHGRVMLGPGLLFIGGAAIIVASVAWQLDTSSQQSSKIRADERQQIQIRFEPNEPYEVSEISHGHVLNTVRIGFKAFGKTFSNCKVYIAKIAPEPSLAGGLPILLDGGGFVLRPDDPEKLVDIAAHWDHVSQFRFNAPPAPFAEAMNYLSDGIVRVIEIRIETTELQKSATFKIWTDNSKKLHLAPM